MEAIIIIQSDKEQTNTISDIPKSVRITMRIIPVFISIMIFGLVSELFRNFGNHLFSYPIMIAWLTAIVLSIWSRFGLAKGNQYARILASLVLIGMAYLAKYCFWGIFANLFVYCIQPEPVYLWFLGMIVSLLLSILFALNLFRVWFAKDSRGFFQKNRSAASSPAAS